MTTTTERPPLTENPIFIEDAATIAAASTGSESLSSPSVGRLIAQPALRNRSHMLVIRPCESDDPSACAKPLWRVSDQVLPTLDYLVQIEVSVEQLGLPGDAVASESPWPLLWSQPHSLHTSRRGVFFVAHRRPTIFEQRVVLRTASLPWWKPQITLNRRLFEKRND